VHVALNATGTPPLVAGGRAVLPWRFYVAVRCFMPPLLQTETSSISATATVSGSSGATHSSTPSASGSSSQSASASGSLSSSSSPSITATGVSGCVLWVPLRATARPPGKTGAGPSRTGLGCAVATSRTLLPRAQPALRLQPPFAGLSSAAERDTLSHCISQCYRLP